MTISKRIFDCLSEIKMSQKEFSEKTSISQSTISEWKSKGTNPTSEKIMIICSVLGVSPEWLLSGADNNGERESNLDWYVIDKKTEVGIIISEYNNMNEKQRDRLMGYIAAISEHYKDE